MKQLVINRHMEQLNIILRPICIKNTNIIHINVIDYR